MGELQNESFSLTNTTYNATYVSAHFKAKTLLTNVELNTLLKIEENRFVIESL